MVATLFRRVVRCEVADRTFDRLKIAFLIERESDETPPAGRIEIFNLAVATEDEVLERGREISLEAGYPETVAEIFRGRVEKVSRLRSGTSRITAIDVTSEAQAPDRLGGVTSHSFGGEVPIRQIVTDMAGDLGLGITGLENIPGDATASNWVWSLSTAAGLTVILNRVECTWYEDDGEIRVNKIGKASAGAGDLEVDAFSGLIGVPTFTDEGASITTLLNPLVRVGTQVTVRSKTVDGVWKVASMAHVGDNWTGPFQTRMSLRSLEDSDG